LIASTADKPQSIQNLSSEYSLARRTMSFQFRHYAMRYKSPDGKEKQISASLGSDEEAKWWVENVIERDKGCATLMLRDGTLFVWPKDI
jgi:hypothetical protein